MWPANTARPVSHSHKISGHVLVIAGALLQPGMGAEPRFLGAPVTDRDPSMRPVLVSHHASETCRMSEAAG